MKTATASLSEDSSWYGVDIRTKLVKYRNMLENMSQAVVLLHNGIRETHAEISGILTEIAKSSENLDIPELEQSKQARQSGYTGDACPGCGGFRMRRTGTCLLCEVCQWSAGCS